MGGSTLRNWNFGLGLLPSTKGAATPPAPITMVDPITTTAVKTEINKQVQTNFAPWGNTIPISIGARAVVGKLLWSSDIREVKQAESSQTDNSQTPHYEVDLAISFGRPGATPENRAATKLVNLWAQQILCFNIDDAELASQFNGMSVTFHPGLIDALPDATVQADKGDLTPAWRNQMYAVIRNFPLWLVGLSDGLPDFVGEIWDSTESGPVITPYTMKAGLSGTNHLVGGGAPLMYNAAKNQAYAFIIGPQFSLSTFNLDSMTEVGRIAFDPSYALSPDWMCIHDPVNNFALVESSIANTTPKYLVNLATGKVMQTLGKGSTHLGDDVLNDDPLQVEMVFKASGAWFQTRLEGLVFNGFLTGAFLGGALGVVWYAHDGSAIQLVDQFDIGAENIRDICAYPIVGRADLGIGITGVGPFSLTPPAQQDAYCFVAHGSKVTAVHIGNNFVAGPVTVSKKVNFHVRDVFDVANFPGGTTRSVFIDPSDNNLVCIWEPNDVLLTSYMTKIRVLARENVGSFDGHSTTGWRPIVGPVLWQVLLPHPFAAEAHFSMHEVLTKAPNSIGYLSRDDNFVEVDSATGAIRRVIGLSGHSGTNGFLFNARSGSLENINRSSDYVEHIQLFGTSNSPMPLSDIISAYLQSAHYKTSQFSVDAGIDDLAYGSMVDQSTDLWSMMQNLGVAYNFQYFISGSQIKFKRPAPTAEGAAFTIDLDTLAQNSSEPFDAIQTTFAAPSEAPGNVGITYIDKEQHYVSNTQTFRRTNFPSAVTNSANDTTVPVPIVMKAAEALRRSAVATFTQDAQNEVLSFKLPTVLLAAEPVDIIRIKVNEFIYNVLIGEIILDPDWTLSTTGSNLIVNANDRFRVGPDGNWISPGGPPLVADPPTPPSKPTSTSPSEPLMLDMPLLTAADNLSNAYLTILCGAISQVVSGWTGATVSTEVGSDPWATFFNASAYVSSGQTFDALPPTSTPFQTDTTTVITVDPANFDPSTVPSVSDEDFRAGKNAIVVGSFGRWELIYFRDATMVDDKVQLSTLIRGCRGTENFTDLHVQSDPLYFISLGGERQTVIGQSVAFDRIGDTFSERARGDNFAGNIASLQAPIEGQSLKPWAPAEPQATLGSAVNVSGTPSYANACGGGTPVGGGPSRTHLITVTANTIGADGSLPEHLVDGDTSSSADHSFHITGGQTNLAWTFDFRPSGLKQVITALTYDTQGGAPTGGTYTVEASDDRTAWTTLATGITISAAVENSWSNSTGFYFYRVRQDSGTTLNHVGHEFWFKTLAEVGANDLLIQWKRRDRLGTGSFLAAALPMSEDVESYDLDIFKGGVKVRTVTGLPTSTYQYSEANQTSDGFAAPLTSLDVNIYQNSLNVGRGFVRDATLDVEG